VKPGRRRSGAARSAWIAGRIVLIVALMAYGGWRGSTLVLGASNFQVSRITVRGNERLATGEVLALVSDLQRQHILAVDLGEWRERLLSSPWVEEAHLRRVLPATIEIEVRERRPIGIGRVADGLYLVDARGVLVDEYGPNYADLDLPIIDGLTSSPRAGRPLVDERRVELAARLIAALETRPDLAARVSQIDVSDGYDAVVLLEGDTAMLRLGESDFIERLQSYIDLAPALRARVAEIDYVDLRFGERLYVRPVAGRSGRPSGQSKEH
jgi:cell division protein FtsQ